jgi:hypothetical protein
MTFIHEPFLDHSISEAAVTGLESE